MTTAAAANKLSMVVNGGNVTRVVHIQKSVPWPSILTRAFPGLELRDYQFICFESSKVVMARAATSAGHILPVYKGIAFPSLLRNFTGLSHQQVLHSSKALNLSAISYIRLLV
jgi:hypothetical protein